MFSLRIDAERCGGSLRGDIVEGYLQAYVASTRDSDYDLNRTRAEG